MYLGTYEHAIDDKGRLFIPAKFREGNEENDGRFILTRGLESCLYLFSPKTFHDILTNKLNNLTVRNQQDARAFKRLLLSGAHDVALDEMGRVLITKTLADHAGLKKDISILGVGERIELWAKDRWKAYSRKASPTFERMGKHLEI
jgi:MraZ protein